MSDRPKKLSNYRWPIIIVSLLASHMALMILCVSYAVQGHAKAGVTPDYYQKALSWDAAREQTRTNEALGWVVTLTPELFSQANGQRTLKVHVTDAAGNAVDGASVQLEAYHAIYPKTTKTTGNASANPAGHYEAQLKLTRHGLWMVTATITRDQEVFVQTFEQQIAPWLPETSG